MLITYAAPSRGTPMALRIKLRLWKNKIKKTHMNAKSCSSWECVERGWTEREIEGKRPTESGREREREGEGGRERGRGGEYVNIAHYMHRQLQARAYQG